MNNFKGRENRGPQTDNDNNREVTREFYTAAY